MEIEIFCLYKAVPVNALKQPTFIDVFDVKTAEREPILVDSFLVASSVRVFRADEGQHEFSIKVTTPSGDVSAGPREIVSFSQLTRESMTYLYIVTMPSVL